MVKNWLITGGCGFLGTVLIKHLIDQKMAGNIRVIDNLSVGTKANLSSVCDFVEIENTSSFLNSSPSSKAVELIIADICEQDKIRKICHNIDIVVHLAANTGVPDSVENPRIDMVSNVVGTFNMLEEARNRSVGRFIFASSGAPLGEVIPPIHEEIAAHPVSPYGASKLSGEGYCSSYFNTYGLETVVLRFGNVYGPGSSHKSSVVAKFIKNAIHNQPLEIYGDGNQTRDFIYVEDLINAIIKGGTKRGVGGEIFQIATGIETTIAEMADILANAIKHAIGKNPTIKKASPRIGDVKRNYFDTSKAKRLLEWACEWSLDDGLRKTVEWFLKQNP